MRIEDHDSIHDTNDPKQIAKILHKRFGNGCNSFMLSHGDERHPVINLLANGDLAYLCYWPDEDHPGYNSIGGREGLNPDGQTSFFLTELTPHEMPNLFVVSFSDALKAAQEFAVSKGLPKSIPWEEL
jgi:hypothetical protein